MHAAFPLSVQPAFAVDPATYSKLGTGAGPLTQPLPTFHTNSPFTSSSTYVTYLSLLSLLLLPLLDE
jgi:hypothetical protein